uniref:Secretory calcium-binding phosphosphoprotein proline-glutamine-rich 7 n=1 Tax=Lepisosteus oculatus TaxID=7918 RepID=A0A125R3M5_LEPOC|nr:secretory calcium-binding phosphosphoprotein proline-glutamine-rich 7 [Lepisosteus oculatus]
MIKVLVLLSALLCAVSCLPMFDILHPQRHLASSKKFRPKHHFNRHWSTLGGWEIIRRPCHPCQRKPARTTTYPPKVTTEAVSRAWSTSQSLITSAGPVYSVNPLTTTAAAPFTASTTTPATPVVTTTTTYPPKVTTEALSRAWSTSQNLITSAAPVDSANPLTTTAAAPVTALTTTPATPVVTTRVTGVISTTEERGDI